MRAGVKKLGVGLLGLASKGRDRRPERCSHHAVHGLRQDGQLEEDTKEEDGGQTEVARKSKVVCHRTKALGS